MLELSGGPVFARRRDGDRRLGGRPGYIEVSGKPSPDGDQVSFDIQASMPGEVHGPFQIAVTTRRSDNMRQIMGRIYERVQALACTEVTLEPPFIVIRPAYPYRELKYFSPVIVPNVIYTQVVKIDGGFGLSTPSKINKIIKGRSSVLGTTELIPSPVGYRIEMPEVQARLAGLVGQNISFDTR